MCNEVDPRENWEKRWSIYWWAGEEDKENEGVVTDVYSPKSERHGRGN
jgi:hypothetical protein